MVSAPKAEKINNNKNPTPDIFINPNNALTIKIGITQVTTSVINLPILTRYFCNPNPNWFN